MLDKIYEIGNEKVEKEFSLERVLIQLRRLKVLMKHCGWLNKDKKFIL